MRIKSGDSVGTTSRMVKLLLYVLAGVAAMGAGAQKKPPMVRVDSGELQGVADDGVVSYKGIPFAAPPVGELRWRPPQPAARWTGVRQAAEFGADCMQGRLGPPPGPAASAERAPSEDCLFVNVWSPASAAPGAKLPVMFWIYGGGFVFGSSALPNTSGTQFAKNGVVLVAANYRVGRFGFFAFPSLSRERPDELKGNYAYMDQIAALRGDKCPIIGQFLVDEFHFSAVFNRFDPLFIWHVGPGRNSILLSHDEPLSIFVRAHAAKRKLPDDRASKESSFPLSFRHIASNVGLDVA
jgi:para-nitrobenzyl esterase